MARLELDRRSFLRLGVPALAGVTALGANEAHTIERGVETAEGVFMPLYETHNRHVTPDKMPKGTNIYFTEITGRYGKELFEGDPYEVVSSAVLDKTYILSQNKTELMVGDVSFSDPALVALNVLPALEAAGGASLAAKTGYWPGHKRTNIEENKRRKLIKVGGAGLAAWLIFPNVISGSLALASLNFDQNNGFFRTLNRFGSLNQYLHPEQAYAVFRSLVMANKLLEVAKDYKERTGQKARISFNVGGGHAQMEDFLQAGQDVCRKLIVLHPKPILENSIDNAGGVVNFCTARIFKVSVTEGLVEVDERKVIDKELRKQIEHI